MIPLFQGSNARESIRPSLVVMAKPRAWAGSQQQEVVWIPVEGQARVEFEGQTLVAAPDTVMRIPIGYESKVTITPLGGRFAAVVLGIGKK